MDPRIWLPRTVLAIATMFSTSAFPLPIALKVGVTEEGLYRIKSSDLARLGMETSAIDPRTIKISQRGVEIPIYVQGEEDGMFGDTDYILFYGTAIKSIYTVTNVYWLTSGGSPGQRMKKRTAGTASNLPVAAHFPATLHAEQDTHYWQAIPNGGNEDHWFWGDQLNAPESRQYLVSVKNLSTNAATAIIQVRLKGLTDVGSVQFDHHTKVYLNGSQIDDQFWDGQMIYDQQVTISHALLNEGMNRITVKAVGDTGASVDQVFVNWIEIGYWHTYVAENDASLFRAPGDGGFQFAVTGFNSNDVEVFDVTDPVNVIRITEPIVDQTDGHFRLRFDDSAQVQTRYLARTVEQRKIPASIEIDQPSHWRTADNGADYIIITHEDFYGSVSRLADYRRASGMRVVTAKVGDIYDEFNDGIFDPQAIRDFLSYAYYQWTPPAPTYVLLVGDASLDYKDNFKTGTLNFVPSQIVQTEDLGDTPSDNWFVLVNGDDILPDLHIGRLPVQTSAELEGIVDKIIRYEQAPPDNTWNRNVLFVADDDDLLFEQDLDELASLLPSDYVANKVHVRNYPPGSPTSIITSSINRGSLFVTYSGHGSVGAWGRWNGSENIFDRTNVLALENTNKLTIVTVADCLNGYFVGQKDHLCLAEELLRIPEKGAVAVWAPTGFSYESAQFQLMKDFYSAIFSEPHATLGAAITAAKIATYANANFGGELVETFVLFGDPALKLSIPNVAPKIRIVIQPLPTGECDLQFATSPGWDYTVLYKDDLSSTLDWRPLPGAPHNSGKVTDGTASNTAQRFYRVLGSKRSP